MRTILAIIFMTFATQASAEEIRLECETISEFSTRISKNSEILYEDDTIISNSGEIVLDNQYIDASFTLFKNGCDKFETSYYEDKISSICANSNITQTLELSRYTGLVTFTYIQMNADESIFMHSYSGNCKKSKKLF